jgi:hypothetical protein
MNSTDATNYTNDVTYPACYDAAAEAYAAGANDDQAYAAAQAAAMNCVRAAENCSVMSAMNAAYEATVNARNNR